MEQYSDLRILDCNRLHSVEGVSGNDNNPALFTNELGDGVRLEVGDQVSIQNAFVSEIGAGADTIEIKGEPLYSASGVPLTKTLYYTDELPAYPTRSWDTSLATQNLITGFQKITSTNSSSKTVWFFPRINGVNIEGSTMKTTIKDNNHTTIQSRSGEFTVAEDDYMEVMWATDDIAVRLDNAPATSFSPATPSVTLMINEINV